MVDRDRLGVREGDAADRELGVVGRGVAGRVVDREARVACPEGVVDGRCRRRGGGDRVGDSLDCRGQSRRARGADADRADAGRKADRDGAGELAARAVEADVLVDSHTPGIDPARSAAETQITQSNE